MLLLPFVLIPLFIALLWNRCRVPEPWIGYMLTALVVVAYPFIYRFSTNYFYPIESGHPKCGIGETAFLFSGFFLQPISLLLYFVFTRIFPVPDNAKMADTI